MNIGTETETIEFKKTTSELKEGIISMSSILNKHGRGVLYFGVRDSGEVSGQDVGKDTLRNISRGIAGNINPPCYYEVSSLKSDDGKDFIEITFSGNDAPYSAFGKFYERFADEDKQISVDQLNELFLKKRKDYSLWENSSSDCDLKDISIATYKRVLNGGLESGRLPKAEYSPEMLFSRLGLISGNYLNNAGKALFGAVSPVTLKLAAYATENKLTFLSLNNFEGNIFECIDEGIRFINKSINWDIEISGEAKRRETPEIPEVAIREIVINAFAHGDYSGNTNFEIDIFSDRVEIYNPGFFPIGLTPDDFVTNNQSPIVLNPKIVNVLFKAGEIESFGTGFQRAFIACDNAKVKYDYGNTKTGFRFSFMRPIKKQSMLGSVYMSRTEKAVYDLLQDDENHTAKIIAEKIGKSEKTVYRALKSLQEKGMILRDGSDTRGIWKIVS